MSRTMLAVALGVLFITLFGLAWPRDSTGIPDDDYWAIKLAWRHEADVVVAGDSRTKLGISPDAMEEALPDLRVLNFGFDRVGFSEDYLEAAARILDPDSERRVVVLGMTPHALTPGAIAHNRFEHVKDRPPQGLTLLGQGRSRLKRLYHQLSDPVSPKQLVLRLVAPELATRHVREVFADGWIASDLVPHRPEEGIATAREWFRDNGVTREVVEGVLETVRAWTDAGIEVWAFRPPTTDELARLEDELSGYDEDAFRRAFEDAGGRWAEVRDAGCETYDSSHLDRESATVYSRRLAEVIAHRGEP